MVQGHLAYQLAYRQKVPAERDGATSLAIAVLEHAYAVQETCHRGKMVVASRLDEIGGVTAAEVCWTWLDFATDCVPYEHRKAVRWSYLADERYSSASRWAWNLVPRAAEVDASALPVAVVASAVSETAWASHPCCSNLLRQISSAVPHACRRPSDLPLGSNPAIVTARAVVRSAASWSFGSRQLRVDWESCR